MQEIRVWPLGREIPWRREWQRTPVFLPGGFHGQRSLVGYSPRGCRTQLSDWHFHFHRQSENRWVGCVPIKLYLQKQVVDWLALQAIVCQGLQNSKNICEQTGEGFVYLIACSSVRGCSSSIKISLAFHLLCSASSLQSAAKEGQHCWHVLVGVLGLQPPTRWVFHLQGQITQDGTKTHSSKES